MLRTVQVRRMECVAGFRASGTSPRCDRLEPMDEGEIENRKENQPRKQWETRQMHCLEPRKQWETNGNGTK